MTKRLRFVGPLADQRYALVRGGFLEHGGREAKGIAVIAAECEILAALNRIGHEIDLPAPASGRGFALLPGGGVVELTGSQFDLLRAYLEGAVCWPTRWCLEVRDMLEWLAQIAREGDAPAVETVDAVDGREALDRPRAALSLRGATR